jgi:DTW domain-containing protein YfiP
VALVVHAKELKRTTNTGRLAVHALVNSEMRVRGRDREPLDLSALIRPDYQSCVLYPSDDAIALGDLASDKPMLLIVPDGNWRQASKVNTRHPELRHLPRVKVRGLPEPGPILRREHFIDGLSTLQAIALALAEREGEEVGRRLLALYQAKLAATLRGRGSCVSTETWRTP